MTEKHDPGDIDVCTPGKITPGQGKANKWLTKKLAKGGGGLKKKHSTASW